MIPSMEYIILTHKKAPINLVMMSAQSAWKQSNCKIIRIVKVRDDESVLSARMAAFKRATTDYFVSMDDDITLKDGWIEEMWPYMKPDTVIGGIVATSVREVKYRNTITKPLKRVDLGKLQNTILRKDWFIDMSCPREIGIDDHMFVNMKLVEMGLDWYLVPVISIHTVGYKPEAFKEGIRAAARRRRLGTLSKWSSLIRSVIAHIVSGIKIGIKTRDPYFIVYFSKMGLGYLIGFGKWSVYCEKYDYSARW